MIFVSRVRHVSKAKRNHLDRFSCHFVGYVKTNALTSMLSLGITFSPALGCWNDPCGATSNCQQQLSYM
jgi:hypothetical protein